MIELHLDKQEIDLIRGALGADESYDDLLTMGDIIAEGRMNYRPVSSRRKQARFAFITLCAISWPGKPPTYKAEVRKLRRSFRGIYHDDTLKEHFRLRLTDNLVAVESYEDLNFHDIASIFHPPFPTARPAVMRAGASASDYDDEEDESEDDKESASEGE